MNLGNPNSKLSADCPPRPKSDGGAAEPPLCPHLSPPRRLLAQLAASDVAPSPQINALFSELVNFALSVRNPEILSDNTALSQLHALCARAEAELERYWAGLIAQRRASIYDFPYWENYLALAEGESAALHRNTAGSRLVFIGCGPLPLSAIALIQVDPRWQLTCIDSDPQAIKAASSVLASLGLEAKITTGISAGEHFDYGSAEIALLASLAGTSTQAKLPILSQVARTSRPGTLIAARSVPPDGRRLLYPRLDSQSLTAELGWPLRDMWQPRPPVINSLLIWRRPEDSRDGVGH